MQYIKHERQCFIIVPNTEKRFENTTRSGVFLTKLEVFGKVMKQSRVFDKYSQSKVLDKYGLFESVKLLF